MKYKLSLFTLIFLISIFSVINIAAQPFELKQATVATTGGGTSSGGLFSLDSTIGQPAATTDNLMGGMFTLRTGFRTPAPFAPTAALVQIRGRVLLGKRTGIKNAVVSLAGGSLTDPLIVRTNQFGYFTFNDVEVGHFYILTVSHKRYRFSNNTLTFMLFNNAKGLVFRADGEN